MSKLRVTKTLLTLAMALALCGAMVVSAQALPAEIDFNIMADVSGKASISYAGGGLSNPNPLVGSSIPVFSITGLHTPANSGVTLFLPTNALLGFTTGNFTGFTGEEWLFGGGGSISVIGAIPAQTPVGGTPFGGSGATLLSGQFAGTEDVDQAQGVAGPTNFYITGASFFDQKDAALLAYYGLSFFNGLDINGNLNISFNASGQTPPNAFSSTQVLSGDVVNMVPIPPSALLLGSGLLGLVGLGWRRKKA
jgi:hypothetical protein